MAEKLSSLKNLIKSKNLIKKYFSDTYWTNIILIKNIITIKNFK